MISLFVMLQGKTIFVYDVDTVHNLSVTFQVLGYKTSNPKVVPAADLIAEPSIGSDREGHINIVGSLDLFPENMSGNPCVLNLNAPNFLWFLWLSR